MQEQFDNVLKRLDKHIGSEQNIAAKVSRVLHRAVLAVRP